MSALDLDALRCEAEALQAERDTARVEAPRTTTGCGRARLRTQSLRALVTLCAHDYCALVRVCT